MEATKNKTKTATSHLSSATSLVNLPRVLRADLQKRLIHALDEDGLVTLCADKGYGAQSLVRATAAHLKAHKQRVLLYNFSNLAKQDVVLSLKGLLERIESRQKTYLFLLDFPPLEEAELQGALGVVKKIQKRARLCIAGSSGLVLLAEMLQDQICAHRTFFAQDLLVGEKEYKFFALSDEETYQAFLKSTNGIISLAENRYQAAHHRARGRRKKATAGTRPTGNNVSAARYSAVDLLMTAVEHSLLQEEKEVRSVLALLGEGSLSDLKDLGLRVTPEMLDEIARDAPIFGVGAARANFTLPEGIACPVSIASFCLENFEETFFAVIRKLGESGRSPQVHALLNATVSHAKVQRYIVQNAGTIYEKGGAELLFRAGALLGEHGRGVDAREATFLKVAHALSNKRTSRWAMESCLTPELFASISQGERAQLQYLILLYEVAHQYKSVRQSLLSACDSYAPLEHFDPGLPQTLRSLASFLFIRRAFLQNDMRRAAQRAEIARVDCNYTSFSGALLTLALFEVELLEVLPSSDVILPGNLDEAPLEVKYSLKFLHQPGYETVYHYERCFLELILNYVESDQLAGGVREVQSASVKNRDDVMVVVALCALAYNDLFAGHLEKSRGTLEEASFLARKARIPLLQEITSVLEEALRPAENSKGLRDGWDKTPQNEALCSAEENKEVRDTWSKTTKRGDGARRCGVDARKSGDGASKSADGARKSADVDPYARHAPGVSEIGSTPDLIRFILRQTKRKMALKCESTLRNSLSSGVPRSSSSSGALMNSSSSGADATGGMGRHDARSEEHCSVIHLPQRKAYPGGSADLGDCSYGGATVLDELPPSFVAAPFSLNGLWAGLLHLIIEKVEDLGAELLPELPTQWRNVLIEKSRSFLRRKEERAARGANGALALVDGFSADTYPFQFSHSSALGNTLCRESSSQSSALGATPSRGTSPYSFALNDTFFRETSPSGFLGAQRAQPMGAPAAHAHNGKVVRPEESAPSLTYPILHISLLDNFSIRLGDISIPDTAWRRESSKNLLILLAAASGHSLSRQILFRKLWPELDYLGHVNNLYTALSDLRKVLALSGNCTRRSVPYIVSSHGMLSLNTQVVDVDVDALFAAVKKVTHPATSDSVKRTKALEILILFGRGPKFPRGFSQMPEAEYLKNQLSRDFAAASIEGGLAAWRMGYFRDATKLALAAVAASQLQEDIVVDAMKMLIDMGKTEEVHRMYKVFQNHYKKRYGREPEGAVRKLYQSLFPTKKAPLTTSSLLGREGEVRMVA